MRLRRLCQYMLPIAISLSVTSGTSAFAQAPAFQNCVGTVFSTEEDFISRIGEEYDGNPVISDGDLLALDPLSGNVAICARNRELIPTGPLAEVDQALGVDAADVISPDDGIIAFSTELDEQFGLFGHGDILFPNGTVIPNEVLVTRFQLPANVGLDAVHFTGRREAILEAIKLARELGRDALRSDPNTYLDRIKELEVDIWFSIEGTGEPPDNPAILDGDLLSAVGGVVVVPQDGLFDGSIPAGILQRGVDFGLDAVTASRGRNIETIQFSSEILYRGERPFTDGDILALGGAVNLPNESLIKGFRPRVDFLGLDALSVAPRDVRGEPHIDTLCGPTFSAWDFGTDGLWRANFLTSPPGNPPRRPCGESIAIGGTLPAGLSTPTGTITRFRVTYESLDPAAPPLAGGVQTTWRLSAPSPVFPWLCVPPNPSSPTLSTDADGWMNAADFIAARDGTLAGVTTNGIVNCANGHLSYLAVWNTKSLPNDRENDLMRLQLEWETTGSPTVFQAPVTHNVQLDNILPALPAYPNALQVRLTDGVTLVPACGEAPTGASIFQVWGDFKDPHYWYFTLTIEGGDPPVTHRFSRTLPAPPNDFEHEYFETPDAPMLGIKNTNAGGTVGMGLVHLRNINMTELGDSFVRCCYLLELRVFDASIRHRFAGILLSTRSPSRRAITTFEAGS